MTRKQTFQAAIRKWRESKGYTQAEAAQAIGIPVWSLRNYEQAKRLPRAGAKIRQIAAISPEIGKSLGITA